MKRKQLYFTAAIDDRLRRLAQTEGRSEAALVREALETFLGEEAAPADPILALAGIGRTLPAAER